MTCPWEMTHYHVAAVLTNGNPHVNFGRPRPQAIRNPVQIRGGPAAVIGDGKVQANAAAPGGFIKDLRWEG